MKNNFFEVFRKKMFGLRFFTGFPSFTYDNFAKMILTFFELA
jgi:hypothetical protein